MKLKITFILFLYVGNYLFAQIDPMLHHNNVISEETPAVSIAFYNNEVYIPDTYNGRLLKTSALTPNAPVTEVLTNVQAITGIEIINDELYFLQAFTSLTNATGSGRLSKIDLTQENPSIIEVASSLNFPIYLSGSEQEMYVAEFIGEVDPIFFDLDFESVSISRINLSNTSSKTVLFEDIDELFDMKFDGTHLYWLAIDNDFNDTLFRYQVSNSTPVAETFFSFDEDIFVEKMYIHNNTIYLAHEDDVNFNEELSIKSIDLNETEITLSSVSSVFQTSGNDIYPLSMTLGNNNLFVGIESYNFSTDEEKMLLYKLDLSLLSTENVEQVLNNFAFYPNPAEHQIHFLEEVKHIEIYDVNGKKVSENSNFGTRLEVSNLSTGTYLIKGYTADNIKFQTKLIKK